MINLSRRMFLRALGLTSAAVVTGKAVAEAMPVAAIHPTDKVITENPAWTAVEEITDLPPAIEHANWTIDVDRLVLTTYDKRDVMRFVPMQFAPDRNPQFTHAAASFKVTQRNMEELQRRLSEDRYKVVTCCFKVRGKREDVVIEGYLSEFDITIEPGDYARVNVLFEVTRFLN